MSPARFLRPLTAMSFALSRTPLSLWSKRGPTAFRTGLGLMTRTPKALWDEDRRGHRSSHTRRRSRWARRLHGQADHMRFTEPSRWRQELIAGWAAVGEQLLRPRPFSFA